MAIEADGKEKSRQERNTNEEVFGVFDGERRFAVNRQEISHSMEND